MRQGFAAHEKTHVLWGGEFTVVFFELFVQNIHGSILGLNFLNSIKRVDWKFFKHLAPMLRYCGVQTIALKIIKVAHWVDPFELKSPNPSKTFFLSSRGTINLTMTVKVKSNIRYMNKYSYSRTQWKTFLRRKNLIINN